LGLPRSIESTAKKKPQREVWSFKPLQQTPLPAVKNLAWVKSPIDRFILAALEANQLSPAPPTDPLTWIQRVTFDLTGLPPSEAEVREFLADKSESRVVDRLLASPRYGEKWGRHWLDVARYADSTGADEDYRYPHAWRYRDYVIDAFNRDLPYDQFIREQVASGRYANASEVVREALREYEEEQAYRAYVREKVARGEADIAAGRMVAIRDPEEYAEDVMNRADKSRSLKAAG
jgi:putative addiction module CopG family antidote